MPSAAQNQNPKQDNRKMRSQIIAILTAIAAVILCSCEDIVTYDPMPQVSFSKVYVADTLDALQNEIKLQRIHMEVIDGDGNLGLNRDDNTGPYSPDSVGYNNLYISIFSKINGEYRELSNLSDKMHYRIPFKEPIGQNKYMKAEVIVKVEIPIASFDYDTIRYEFFVYDRDLNKSEVARSCDIAIRNHGTTWADGHTSYVKKEDDNNTKQ